MWKLAITSQLAIFQELLPFWIRKFHLIYKTNIFLWVPIFAYFIEDQIITLGKKACAVEIYANPLAIVFFVIWVHIAKVYIRWS